MKPRRFLARQLPPTIRSVAIPKPGCLSHATHFADLRRDRRLGCPGTLPRERLDRRPADRSTHKKCRLRLPRMGHDATATACWHRTGAGRGHHRGKTCDQCRYGGLFADAFPCRAHRCHCDAAARSPRCTGATASTGGCADPHDHQLPHPQGTPGITSSVATLWVHSDRATAVIGRAIRLALINILEVRPGGIDRSTLGHPGKFSYCIAEDEENTSWLPLSVERGLPPEVSAVTVLAAGSARQLMNEWTTRPEEIQPDVCQPKCAPTCRHYSNLARQAACPHHPAAVARASAAAAQLEQHPDIARFIHERARIHRREWADAGKGAVVRDRGDTVYTALKSPDQLLVVAAGGPAGGFGAVIPPWFGHKSFAVTEPIGVCVDCEPPKS